MFCLGGLTGSHQTTSRVGHAAAIGDWAKLQEEINVLSKTSAVYRGGQHSGAIAVCDIAASVKEYVSQLGETVEKSLGRLRAIGMGMPPEASRKQALYEIMSTLEEAARGPVVKGFSQYSTRRIVEMLLLAASGCLCDMQIKVSDLRVLHGVYPPPNTPMTALLCIFHCNDCRCQAAGVAVAEEVVMQDIN